MGKKTSIFLFFLMLGVFSSAASVCVQAEDATPFKSTPYPVPRFVSLDSGEVYVRTGPGKRYPIKWIFKKKGLPVEIVLEYDNWRKIKDIEGQMGWVYGPLLSGRRTGLIESDGLVDLYQKPKAGSRILAKIENKALVKIEECQVQYCAVEGQGYKGWVQRQFIWGIYDNEVFD